MIIPPICGDLIARDGVPYGTKYTKQGIINQIQKINTIQINLYRTGTGTGTIVPVPTQVLVSLGLMTIKSSSSSMPNLPLRKLSVCTSLKFSPFSMMFRKCSLIAILSLYQTGLSIVDAFIASVSTTRQVNHNSFNVADLKLPLLPLPSTCLSMAEEDSQEAAEEFVHDKTEDEKPNASTEDANDILSSPAFLKRKLEVLQSDITTTEEDLAKSVERLEVAKEEWGPQLDALQNEVNAVLSVLCCCCNVLVLGTLDIYKFHAEGV